MAHVGGGRRVGRLLRDRLSPVCGERALRACGWDALSADQFISYRYEEAEHHMRAWFASTDMSGPKLTDALRLLIRRTAAHPPLAHMHIELVGNLVSVQRRNGEEVDPALLRRLVAFRMQAHDIAGARSYIHALLPTGLQQQWGSHTHAHPMPRAADAAKAGKKAKSRKSSVSR